MHKWKTLTIVVSDTDWGINAHIWIYDPGNSAEKSITNEDKIYEKYDFGRTDEWHH